MANAVLAVVIFLILRAEGEEVSAPERTDIACFKSSRGTRVGHG